MKSRRPACSPGTAVAAAPADWGRAGWAIVIPTWQEAATLPPLLQQCQALLPGALLFVADGGSPDDTVALARAAGATVVLTAEPGRGLQLRAGAAAALAAGARWLLCLHADSRLPSTAPAVLAQWAARPLQPRRPPIATFRLRFDDRAGAFLQLCAWFSRFDSAWTRFGDQGLAIAADFYQALGGFPPWPILEDVEMLRRARRHGPITSLPAALTTSSRRYLAEGRWRRQWRNAVLLYRFFHGANPHDLAADYRRASPPPPTPPLA